MRSLCRNRSPLGLGLILALLINFSALGPHGIAKVSAQTSPPAVSPEWSGIYTAALLCGVAIGATAFTPFAPVGAILCGAAIRELADKDD